MEIRLEATDTTLIAPLQELALMLPLDIGTAPNALLVRFSCQPGGITLERDELGFCVTYERRCEAMRAFGLVAEHSQEAVGFFLSEMPAFSGLGALLDCSRNGVLHIEACKRLFRLLALMGYSEVQLYTEDVYELDGHPYFGYLRGAYTKKELRLLDAYALQFGLELVPCIQTLAHLENVLRWKSYGDMLDCNDILLIDSEESYALIEAMFASMAENLSSRRINIGMDEAAMIGCGKYAETHPHTDKAELMAVHLSRVCEIARKYNYRPMMWSDMFFQQHYGEDAAVPSEMTDKIPQELSLIYWNYYDTEESVYQTALEKHRALNREVIYAAGAWRWHGFTPGNAFSLQTARAALSTLTRNGVKRVIVASWADNGAEGSVFSMLPTFQFWAESCYATPEDDALARRFLICTGADWKAFLCLDEPLFISDNVFPGKCGYSPSKVLLYADILTGMFDLQVDSEAACTHFSKTEKILNKEQENAGTWAYLFNTQEALCHLLVQKSVAGHRLRLAYQQQSYEVMRHYAEEILPRLCKDIEAFQNAYCAQWAAENKYVGRDVFDLRIGGLKERIRSAITILNQFLRKEISSIEAFEEPLLKFQMNQFHTAHDLAMLRWHQIATPSNITGI